MGDDMHGRLSGTTGRIEGRHAGTPACVICAGPSLRGFDFARCGEAVTIAVNAMGLTVPLADYLVFIDLEPFKTFGAYRTLAETFPGEVFAPTGFGAHFLRPVTEFNERDIWSNRTAAGAAVSLVAAFGCNPIYLLGADFRLAADGAHHAHPGGRAYLDSELDTLRERLEAVIASVRARERVVINVTPRGRSRLVSRNRHDLAAFDLRP
jgi:hypothetical protein